MSLRSKKLFKALSSILIRGHLKSLECYVRKCRLFICLYIVKKLDEEVTEFKTDKNLEELADVMEVLFGLAHKLGYTEQDLLNKRQEKKEARGGFEKNIILKSTK